MDSLHCLTAQSEEPKNSQKLFIKRSDFSSLLLGTWHKYSFFLVGKKFSYKYMATQKHPLKHLSGTENELQGWRKEGALP